MLRTPTPTSAATLGAGSLPNSEPPLSSDAGTAAPKYQLLFHVICVGR
jgi:hypothetical protein